ncbi:MAG: DnaJ domain-containing protein [Candidatus Moeniiplasma glomeromycotorum]|nr:DnaJ domain-containing protein [Candidatus Moeniiplasma glomeromycotorum]MCE8169552.1 DnaJ domain-containing protein [Candidatus Moeniiplasma glomeromycotorum]
MLLNYYQILKVGTNTTSDQIRKSYQQLRELWNSRKMNKKELNLSKEVFGTLSNLNKRKEYDRRLILVK